MPPVSVPHRASITLAAMLLACGPMVAVSDGSASDTGNDATASATESSPTDSSADETATAPCIDGAPDCPCTPAGTCDPGHTCIAGECAPIVAICGDGIVDPGEECDDGNLTDADGCNADCRPSGSVSWSIVHDGPGVDPDCALGVAIDASDVIVVAGHESRTDLGLGDVMWITKLDPTGSTLWADPSLTMGWATAVAVADDDRLAIGGDVEQGFGPAWLRVLGADGSIVATFDMEGPGPARTVAVTSAGVFVVAASDTAHGLVGGDAPWTLFSVGSRFRGLAAAPGGGLVAGGMHFEGALRRAWAARYDADRTLVWTHTSTDEPLECQAEGIALDGAGNVVIAGYIDQGGPHDVWLRKLAPDGTPLWTRTHDSGATLDDEAHGVAIDGHDRIVVAGFEGRTGSTPGTEVAWIRKYDPDGTPLWTTTQTSPRGLPLVVHAIAIDASDRVAVVGCESATDVDADVWVAQLSP